MDFTNEVIVEVKESEYYKEGYLAYLEGISIKDNPYSIKEICKRWDWCDAWLEARDCKSLRKSVSSYKR